MQSETDELSLIFLALAHPVRRALLAQLKNGKASVSELQKPLDVKKSMMTKHLKILQKAKLIERDQVRQQRFSSLNVEMMEKVKDWIDEYKELWQGKITRLENLYEQEQNKKEK